jgi:hypothetical protein
MNGFSEPEYVLRRYSMRRWHFPGRQDHGSTRPLRQNSLHMGAHVWLGNLHKDAGAADESSDVFDRILKEMAPPKTETKHSK